MVAEKVFVICYKFNTITVLQSKKVFSNYWSRSQISDLRLRGAGAEIFSAPQHSYLGLGSSPSAAGTGLGRPASLGRLGGGRVLPPAASRDCVFRRPPAIQFHGVRRSSVVSDCLPSGRYGTRFEAWPCALWRVPVTICSVGDPDPHLLVRCTAPEPDASLFS
jgi:hypothetical protein